MTVELLRSSQGHEAITLGAPWLMAFEFRCHRGGKVERKIRARDIAHVHVVTQADYDGLDADNSASAGTSFLSGPHLAGRGAEDLVYLVSLTDGAELAICISTSPGTTEDVGAKMFRSHVTTQQQRARK